MIKLIIAIIIIPNIASAFNSNNNSYRGRLADFQSDGCTLFPDGTIFDNKAWTHCCIAHDIEYWIGGSKKQRKDSDEQLRSCVNNVVADDIFLQGLGDIMSSTIRGTGSGRFNTSWKWGYGWSHQLARQRYNKLTTLQKVNARKKLEYSLKALKEYSTIGGQKIRKKIQLKYISSQGDKLLNSLKLN